MECPNCHFLATPGQAAVEGVCPNCERPYRDQPTPLNSDMAVRNMPEPGMEDTGGNPLQEGILGDWQNSKVRDEAFASTNGPLLPPGALEEPEFEVTDVVVPDPDSLLSSKRQMDKQADFLNTLEDVAAPAIGGTAGFLVGGPAGAAIGAGLAGGGMDALQGEGAGHAIGTGLEDAALGGLGGLGGAALTSGTAAEAAGAGATRGGVGSLMKSAWSKVPTDKIKSAYMTHALLNDASNMTQPATPPAPAMQGSGAPIVGPSYYSKVAAPNSTPSSKDHIPSNNTDDPEEVDFKERNDGDNESKGLDSDQAVNDIGGTTLGPDDFFSSDSGALSMLGDLLPKVLQFAVGDQSAAGDPEMEALHKALEAEKPGYMSMANDDDGQKMIMFILKGGPTDEANGDELLPDHDEPHDPIAEHQATALRPGLETTCPKCGSVMDFSNEHCPQCGVTNGMHQPQPTNPDFTSPEQMLNPPQPKQSNQQGPNTDDQKALVAELLIQEGRGDEIPNMIMEPHEYAAELAKITGGEEPPEDIGQPGPPPPIEPAEQQGEMPVPPMSAQPMMAAVKKYAGTVDGFCESCPNCGSHSTGYMDYEEGDAGCKTCGHHWKAPAMVKNSAEENTPNPSGVPAADLEGQHDVEREEDSSLSWTDENGAPLQVGQDYEMYSENYDIPDRVKIDAVKPDVIEFTLVGEYGLNHRTELTHEEASIENVSFVPTSGFEEGEPNGQGDLNQNMDDPPRAETGFEESDSSTPHMMMANRTADFDDINGPSGPNLDPQGGYPVKGTPWCPQCHGLGRLFEAQGVSRMPNGEPPICPICNGTGVQNDMQSLPEVEHPLGEYTGSVDDDVEHGPDWLREEMPHTAGAQMTPWEQRGYIDEIGDARNADKLNLAGTHYEMNEIDDSFLFGL